ncbi:caveolin-3-like isoform X2 [Eriocheir sinensis]|uniref:caveolin-3-like isoform X2 n=1 Tax=Eriocheir sinensis TaxID=95602 RepID=UPI0021C765E3|nr:caveolin-3-like isoform X2 [Eriocheir sinensis]
MLVEGPLEANKLEGEVGSTPPEASSAPPGSADAKARRVGSKGSGILGRMGGEASPFAMDNRDPNNLNPHIQVLWDDIIGEPEGLRTPDGCWNCSQSCYDGTRRCCYVFLVVLLAPFIAFCNGCQFACLAFNQVWCAGPCLRCVKINWATLKKFWEACLFAICSPMAEVCGMYFSKIYVRYQRVPDGNPPDSSNYFNV